MDEEPYVKVTLADIYREVLETKGIVTGQSAEIREHGRRLDKLESDSLSRRGLATALTVGGLIIAGLSFLLSRLG